MTLPSSPTVETARASWIWLSVNPSARGISAICCMTLRWMRCFCGPERRSAVDWRGIGNSETNLEHAEQTLLGEGLGQNVVHAC